VFSALRQFRAIGLLGMNRRNGDYIMRCNPRARYPLVDNKVLTKRLADQHGVPTPALYHVIEHHGDLAGMDAAINDRKRFVVKPARGAGGSGIVLITDRTADGFVNQNGNLISSADLAYHISDILSGIHSLAGLEDSAILEAMIYPDPVFSSVSYEGVPDIRIIVYSGVPVMGMVRLPTSMSDGKANLHRGAIGAGIDIASGKTLSAVCRSEAVAVHPDTGHRVAGIQVPEWEKVLLMAATALDMTGLGYMGVDMVIDREQGPLLLELNARPGLAIQIANRIGLRLRLDAVDAANADTFATPERRVAWARKHFGAKSAESA